MIQVQSVPSASTLFALRLSLVPGVGPAFLRELRSLPLWGELDVEVLRASSSKLEAVLARSPDAWLMAGETASAQLELARQEGAAVLSWDDPHYPAELRDLPDAPATLFVKGALRPTGVSNYRPVAIVGTRHPTPHGSVVAERIARQFAAAGWTVVSGLALGCDTAAHESTVASAGHTVAVLAHGLQTIAPRENRSLADRILEGGGALVTEYPFGTRAAAHQFVRRDRVQAGLSRGVVLIQSSLKGGSLHSCRAALEYKRWLAVTRPTLKDYREASDVVKANLALCFGTRADAMDLLNCSEEDLERIRIIRDRGDYPSIIANG